MATVRLNGLAAGESPVCATGEGHLVTIAGHPCAVGMFERYCSVMGRDDLVADPRFATEADRLAHRSELYGAVRDWVRSYTDLASLEQTLAEAGFAMGVVRTVKEVADSDWAQSPRSDRPCARPAGRHRPHPELAVALLPEHRAGPGGAGLSR